MTEAECVPVGTGRGDGGEGRWDSLAWPELSVFQDYGSRFVCLLSTIGSPRKVLGRGMNFTFFKAYAG